MSKRTSIYIGDGLKAALEHRTAIGDRQVSQTIDKMTERYDYMCRHSMPTFSADEWCYIFAALEDCDAGFAKVATAIRTVILDHKTNLGDLTAGFKDKIKTLNYCQSVAVLDAAERFWVVYELDPDENNYDYIVAIVSNECIATVHPRACGEHL